VNVPRGTRRCRAAETSINAEAAKRIFEQLIDEGVPIELSVPFLVHARGWRIQAFCQEIGVHRAYLHALLQRRYAAGIGIRFGVRQRLGFDPWRETEPARSDGPAPGPKQQLSSAP
jgi:hypothetical protein